MNPDLDENEAVLLDIAHQMANSTPFRVVITGSAFYFLSQKTFAVSDPWYFEKVTLSQISCVMRRKIRAIYSWIISSFLIIGGAIGLYSMYYAAFVKPHKEVLVSGYPFALLLGGIIIPFLAKKRYGIFIKCDNRSYSWKPTFVIDNKSRQEIAEKQRLIIETSRELGVNVIDEL